MAGRGQRRNTWSKPAKQNAEHQVGNVSHDESRPPLLVTSSLGITVDNVAQGIRTEHRDTAIQITDMSDPTMVIPHIVQAWGLPMAQRVIHAIACKNHQDVARFAVELSERCARRNMNEVKQYIFRDIEQAFTADEIAVHGKPFLAAVRLHLRMSLTSVARSTQSPGLLSPVPECPSPQILSSNVQSVHHSPAAFASRSPAVSNTSRQHGLNQCECLTNMSVSS
jgi:hypothetical protein